MTAMVQGSELKQKLQNSKFKRKSMSKTPLDFRDIQSPIEINETRGSSSTPSYSSSLNDFNYVYTDAYGIGKGKDLEVDNSMNSYHINEIMNRLKSQEAKMAIKSKHSEVYKEIITSLLNENLISYSKQYDLYIEETPKITRISHPELSVEEKIHEIKTDKKTILKPKTKRNHSLASTFAQNTTKFASNCSELTLPAINDDGILKKSRPSTKLSFITRTGSSFSMHTQRDALSRKPSLNEHKSELSSYRSKISDLIFRGYKIDEMVDNEEREINMNSSASKNHSNSYVTPSFMIRRFNLSEPKQLELAKEDIYKRYAFINDKSIKLSKHLKYNNTKNASKKIEKPKQL